MKDQTLEKKTVKRNPSENKSLNDIQQDNKIKSLCKYDIIVFGALGFTKEIIITETANSSQLYDLTWAVVGCNTNKLQMALDSIY